MARLIASCTLAIAALAMQLVFLAVSALVLARRYFSTQGLPKPEDRANIIAYLRSLAASPAPLP